jgi:NADPH:quinone reductase-like Zn-dependent oxidoreductase
MNLVYVGIKNCGCMVAAMVDNPEHKKDTAKEIAKWIREGLTIERVTAEYVRENFKKCNHDMKK